MANAANEKIRKPAGARGQGRKKGVPNKITTELREFWRDIIDRQRKTIEKKLAQLAASDPDKYLSRIMDAHEYVIPRLARTEISGPDNGPICVIALPSVADTSEKWEQLAKGNQHGSS